MPIAIHFLCPKIAYIEAMDSNGDDLTLTTIIPIKYGDATEAIWPSRRENDAIDDVYRGAMQTTLIN